MLLARIATERTQTTVRLPPCHRGTAGHAGARNSNGVEEGEGVGMREVTYSAEPWVARIRGTGGGAYRSMLMVAWRLLTLPLNIYNNPEPSSLPHLSPSSQYRPPPPATHRQATAPCSTPPSPSLSPSSSSPSPSCDPVWPIPPHSKSPSKTPSFSASPVPRSTVRKQVGMVKSGRANRRRFIRSGMGTGV